MQVGEDPRYVLVAITLKHFVANAVEGMWTSDGVWGAGGSIGRHTIDVNVSKHDLADTYWPAFRDAIRDADAQGVMCSYNMVRGVPTCLDPLQNAARKAWGFTGYVTSDSDSIADAYTSHHYSESAAAASCQAVSEGGCDVDSGNTYINGLLEGVQNASLPQCTMDDVDERLLNIFRLRFKLGLFDPVDAQPYWNYTVDSHMGTEASRQLNHRAALESLVLLRNDKDGNNMPVLPLAPGINIAVLGPHGNATRELIQVDTGRICESGGFDCVVSPLQALTAANRAGRTVYSHGMGIISNDTSGLAAAVAVAKAADVVVLGVGISECGRWWKDPVQVSGCGNMVPGGGGEYLEGEGHDRSRLDLPPAQQKLLDAVLGLNKPTVVFMLNAGSVGLDLLTTDGAHSRVAVIEAFYPGAEGGTALAQAIFGVENRWGKMPYTTYVKGWENTHSFLDHGVSATGRTYRWASVEDVLVPFGFGLSLTQFALRMSVEGPAPIGAMSPVTLFTNGTSRDVSVRISVFNVGNRRGDEVVQAYVVPVRVAPEVPVVPVKSLFGFQRVRNVAPASNSTVTFTFNVGSMLMVNPAGARVSAPGAYTVRFETGGVATPMELPVQLVGDTVVVEPFPNPSSLPHRGS